MDEINPKDLPPLDTQALEEELKLEQAYGGRPGEAFAGAALSEMSFGATDALARAAGVPAERLREVREREAAATTAGELTGIVGPALVSGGTSLAAKAVSAPVRIATKAGLAAEKATVQALEKAAVSSAEKQALKELAPAIVGDAAEKALTPAQKIAGMAARSAAEGAVIGAGQAVSDIALENKDLSAESVLGSMGAGALYGAGFGATVGTMQASVPSLLKGLRKGKEFVAPAVSQAVDPLIDRNKATLKIFAKTAAQEQKLESQLGKYIDDLPTFATDDLQLSSTDTVATLLKKNTKLVQDTGEALGSLAQQIDEITALKGSPVSRAQVYNKLLTASKQAIDELGPAKAAARPKEKIIRRYLQDIIELGAKEEPFSFKEIDDLRKQYAAVKFKGGGALESFEANFANSLRKVLRESVDDIATKIDPKLGTELKTLNKRYHIGSTVNKYLEFAEKRAPDISSPVGLGLSIIGNVARNAAVIYDVSTTTKNVMEAISTGLNKALVERAPKTSLTLPATNILVKTNFALDGEGKAPKSKKDAFKNVQQNLNDAITNPDNFIDLVAKKTARISSANPALGAAMQQRLATATNFLQSKIPKQAVNPGVFQRPYEPSSLELAKFERYLQVVEQPLTALTELSQGTLTREHVEALQVVYPEIYRQIQMQVMDKVAEGKLKLSYAKKLQLGILLNVPTDSSLQPESILQLQQSIAAQPEPPAPGVQFRPAGMEQTGISERAQSGTEKLSNR